MIEDLEAEILEYMMMEKFLMDLKKNSVEKMIRQ